MISVRVQRSDVAAGDIWDLTAEWEFDDDARILDVLLRAVDTGWLASVAADVAWTFEGGNLGLDRVSGDEWYLERNGPTVIIATLFVNYPRGGAPAESWVSSGVRETRLAPRLADSPQYAIDGGYGFRFGYSSGGGLRTVDSLRAT